MILRHLDRTLQVELSMGKGDQSDQIFGRITDGVCVSVCPAADPRSHPN